MIAGAAKVDITPSRRVWMDGMIREHKSEGVHDPLFARALYLSSGEVADGFVIVSADVCALRARDVKAVRAEVSGGAGLDADHVIVAATHTHSGSATHGFFNSVDERYVAELRRKLVVVIKDAVRNARPALAGCGSGEERTISHYRRLLADDGHVVMNWESWPRDRIVRVLGQPDPEVGVLLVVERDDPQRVVAVLFNHAGHPNVMSGDNYLLSADYPGFACSRVEGELGGIAMFVNGAEGSVDIDGLKDRDWDGVARAGGALADAVIETARRIVCSDGLRVSGSGVRYSLKPRVLDESEVDWAKRVLARTGGKIQARADGIGDDCKAFI
ncbi:MAG: neutral/alkaline non-lysosomal ceramidase N-terminal domain-containing protein, partial [Armatimonadota bacterium]